MHIDNKIQIKRGVNLQDPSTSAGLTLEWTGYGATRATRPSGCDLVVLMPDQANSATSATPLMYSFPNAVSVFGATLDATFMSVNREFFYVTWQGSEQTENSFITVRDHYVKLKDVYATIELKSITAAQYAEIEIGDTIDIDDAGLVGTHSIATAGGAGNYLAVLPGNTHVAVAGTKVVAKTTSTDSSGATVYLIDVVC